MWNLLSTKTLQSHLSDVLISVYRKWHSAVVSAITTSLPRGVNLITDTSYTSGGWYLWMELPNYCDGSFRDRLRVDYNLILAAGNEFEAGLGDFAVIYISLEAENELVEAMRGASRCLQGIGPRHPVRGAETKDLGAEQSFPP